MSDNEKMLAQSAEALNKMAELMDPSRDPDGFFRDKHDRPPIKVMFAQPANAYGEIEDGSVCVNWCPGRCDNGLMMVTGGSGSGKTVAFRQIATEIMLHGCPVLMLDYHGDIETEWIDTILLSSGRGSPLGINPLEVFIHDESRAGLMDQRMALVGMFKRAIPTLSQNQMAILERAIKGAYEYVDIHDNRPETWRFEPPTMRMVIDELHCMMHGKSPYKGQYTPSSVRGCINAVSSVFVHSIFNRRHNLRIRDLFNRSTRLDLSEVDDAIRFIVSETVLRMVFNYLRRLGPVPADSDSDADRFRIYIMIDEAKILAMGKSDPDGRDRILNVLATEGRKYGMGLILASQSCRHFGADVRANAASRLVLRHLDYDEARHAAKGLRLEAQSLLDLRGRGDGYFLDGETGKIRRVRVCRR